MTTCQFGRVRGTYRRVKCANNIRILNFSNKMRLQSKLKSLDVEIFFSMSGSVSSMSGFLSTISGNVVSTRGYLSTMSASTKIRTSCFCGCPHQIRFLVLAIFILTLMCYQRFCVVYQRFSQFQYFHYEKTTIFQVAL